VHRFDTIHPVLAHMPSTAPLAGLEVQTGADGKLLVDGSLETNVPGLFASGDVVSGLNQTSVAVGHAAVAATAMHHRLPRYLRPLEI
jgi:thioredoxin reductase (NADPH)